MKTTRDHRRTFPPATPEGESPRPLALPSELAQSPERARLAAALAAVRGAGRALAEIRGEVSTGRELGDQLKTLADRAAEGWVLGWLEAAFPGELFLAEERFDASGGRWPKAARASGTAKTRSEPRSYWTIDALDGTRSFAGGFAGYCVQAAFIRGDTPIVAAIDEPAFGRTWAAIAGRGAFLRRGSRWTRALARTEASYPRAPRFIDSTPPRGAVGALLARRKGRFVERGSIGGKALAIASGEADVYAKDLRFKLWDVAPADLVLRETGGRLGTWEGEPIPYGGRTVVLERILAAPAGLFERVVLDLAGAAR